MTSSSASRRSSRRCDRNITSAHGELGHAHGSRGKALEPVGCFALVTPPAALAERREGSASGGQVTEVPGGQTTHAQRILDEELARQSPREGRGGRLRALVPVAAILQ